ATTRPRAPFRPSRQESRIKRYRERSGPRPTKRQHQAAKHLRRLVPAVDHGDREEERGEPPRKRNRPKEQRPPEQPQQPDEEGGYQPGRGADSERLIELPVRSNVGTEPQADKPGEGAEAVQDQRAEKLEHAARASGEPVSNQRSVGAAALPPSPFLILPPPALGLRSAHRERSFAFKRYAASGTVRARRRRGGYTRVRLGSPLALARVALRADLTMLARLSQALA